MDYSKIKRIYKPNTIPSRNEGSHIFESIRKKQPLDLLLSFRVIFLYFEKYTDLIFAQLGHLSLVVTHFHRVFILRGMDRVRFIDSWEGTGSDGCFKYVLGRFRYASYEICAGGRIMYIQSFMTVPAWNAIFSPRFVDCCGWFVVPVVIYRR